jgi:hypothetical protein
VQLRSRGFLSLAEVQIFRGNVNVARGKNATQFPDPSPNQCTSANNALDGINASDGLPNGEFGDCNTTHTGFGETPWWQVNLGGPQNPIQRIVLWNRTDCCGERLSNFDVLVSGDGVTFTPIYYRDTQAPRQLEIALGVRHVRVQLRSPGFLSLAEVEVFQGSNNIAQGRPATQSSTLGGFSCNPTADKAVDDDNVGDFRIGCKTSHTSNENQPWWQVDVRNVAFDEIVLWNRTDCCGSRLSDFDVLVAGDKTSLCPSTTRDPRPRENCISLHSRAHRAPPT